MNDHEILKRLRAAVAAGLCSMEDIVAVAEIAAAASTQGVSPEDIAAAVAQTYPQHVDGIKKALDEMDASRSRANGGLVAPGLPLPYVREGKEMFVPIGTSLGPAAGEGERIIVRMGGQIVSRMNDHE